MATWINLTFAVGEYLRFSKMNQLDANFDALAEGAAGAPDFESASLDQTASTEAVSTATIRDDAVTVDKLAHNIDASGIDFTAYESASLDALAFDTIFIFLA